MSTADARIGLCATCAHVQVVTSSRGSIFYMCRLSQTDEEFPKYPVLPVLRCVGYERQSSTTPA